jgi:hypothetical protein
VALAVLATLSACGGGGGGSPATGGVTPSSTPSNPLDQPLTDADVSVGGVTEVGFTGLSVLLSLTATGQNLDERAGTFAVTLNGTTTVQADAMQVSGNQGLAAVNFAPEGGAHDVVIDATDVLGRPLHARRRFWAGGNSTTAKVIDGSAQAWPAEAMVTVSPSEDLDHIFGQSVTGQASFDHLPTAAVIWQARSGMALGVASGVPANGGTQAITLLPMPTSGSAPNLDFGTDLAGWTTPASAQRVAASGGSTGQDLKLSTSGLNPQIASHAFTTGNGVQAATVRYRFVTREDLSADADRRHADYFRMQLRTASGQVSTDTQSIWSLGGAAFDGTGSSGWRTLRVITSPTGDLVDLDAIVANVEPDPNSAGALDSALVIDGITLETSLLQPALGWDAVRGGVQLSASLLGQPSTSNQAVQLYWAAGPRADQRLGTPIGTLPVPQGTSAGVTLTLQVDGAALASPPVGATQLQAVLNDVTMTTLLDVRLQAGPSANLDTLGAPMLTALKAAARQVGVLTLEVAMTGLTPAELAHAMFLNLSRGTGGADVVTANVAAQKLLFGSEGQAVIQVFSQQASGKTVAEVLARQSAIEAAMASAITQQGPTKVLKHGAAPASLLIADVRKASLPDAAAAMRFKAALTALKATVEDEDTRWHVQLPLP